MKIYLLGYMASGKSKIGKELSERTGLSFYDLDEVFEERYRIGISDFFDKYGEPTFRQIEQQLLFETEFLDNLIVATGGGTPCSEKNMRFIKSQGVSIYIRMKIDNLVQRLKTIKKKRPLLREVQLDNLEKFVQNQLEKREPYYIQADYIIEGPLTDLTEIMSLVNSLLK